VGRRRAGGQRVWGRRGGAVGSARAVHKPQLEAGHAGGWGTAAAAAAAAAAAKTSTCCCSALLAGWGSGAVGPGLGLVRWLRTFETAQGVNTAVRGCVRTVGGVQVKGVQRSRP